MSTCWCCGFDAAVPRYGDSMSGCMLSAVQVSSLTEDSGPVAALAVGCGLSSPLRCGVFRSPDAGLRRFLAEFISKLPCRLSASLVTFEVPCWRSIESDAVGVPFVASLLCIQCCCCSAVSSGNFCHSSTLAMRTSLNSSSRGLPVVAVDTSECR